MDYSLQIRYPPSLIEYEITDLNSAHCEKKYKITNRTKMNMRCHVSVGEVDVRSGSIAGQIYMVNWVLGDFALRTALVMISAVIVFF